MAQNWDEKAVFLAALELPREQRAAYLHSVCPDETTRQRIESLLKHHDVVTQEILNAIPSVTLERDIGNPIRIDEFEIIRRIGEGGMGVVYLARDVVLDRQVALKVLAPGLVGSEEALARFRTEARSTAAIHHPGIVPVFKSGVDHEIHYIACEYVDGPTLAQLIESERGRRSGQLSSSELKAWCIQAAVTISAVAEALEAAHRNKIIHRDVKPSNILMDKQHGPRLTDFGVALRLSDDGRAKMTTVLGSCHYMSPEQASIAGTNLDQRSDIFSLGIVLYELVTMRRPFNGATQVDILKAVAESDPPPFRSVDRRIPRDLDVICRKAMEKRPHDRYQTAAHMAADLRCFVAGDPILAQPVGVAKRSMRRIQKHRLAVSLAAILFLVPLTGYLLWRDRIAKLQQLAWLQVECESAGSGVFVGSFDPKSLALSSPIQRAGVTPLDRLYVPTGHHRVTVVAPGKLGFAEFNLMLSVPGNEGETRLVVLDSEKWPNPVAGGGRLEYATLRPVSTVTEDMKLIEAGEYVYGWRTEGDWPDRRRSVTLESFYIDKQKTSNREYKVFLNATGYPAPGCWPKPEGINPSLLDRPVVCVNFADAEAYARWRGKRLPTALEWEAATRGPEGRLYPWGDEPPDPAIVNNMPLADIIARQTSDEETLRTLYARHTRATSDSDPADSVGELLQVLGNVVELTGSIDVEDGAIFVKGRSWAMSLANFRLADALTRPLYRGSYEVGFRCAKSAAIPSTELR